MNNYINIRAVEGGYTVGYSIPNPKYVAPKDGEKVMVYTPKNLNKTRVFTDKEGLMAFVSEHVGQFVVDESTEDYIY